MEVFFIDTSALMKRYALETGSRWVIDRIRPAPQRSVYLSSITVVEIASAVARRQKGGSLTTDEGARAFRRFQFHFANEYRALNISPHLLRRAAELAQKHQLRAYDAVQLACALMLYDRARSRGIATFVLISSDNALNEAALTEGLRVEDPNTHQDM